jgi:hypothetical protein
MGLVTHEPRRMFGRDRHGGDDIHTYQADFVVACEALLDGRYVDELQRTERPVPVWAWMNLLAHGTDEALRREADECPPPWRHRGLWQRARAYLAGEVLDAATEVGTLTSVQAQVLVPLELELLTPSSSVPRHPAGWVVWVLAAIDDHRSTTRSSKP